MVFLSDNMFDVYVPPDFTNKTEEWSVHPVRIWPSRMCCMQVSTKAAKIKAIPHSDGFKQKLGLFG